MSKHHHKEDRERVVGEVLKLLKKKNLSFSDIKRPLETAMASEISVPLSIYSEALTPLESTVKYLRETREMKFSDMGKVLGRDQKAVAITYKSATKKLKTKLIAGGGSVWVPAVIFNSRSLSAFEALVVHLKKSHSFMEISEVLGKDYRTVWTIYSRAVRKKGGK